MKAAVVVANEDVQYQEIEEPQAKPGWVKTVSYTHLDVYKRQHLEWIKRVQISELARTMDLFINN